MSFHTSWRCLATFLLFSTLLPFVTAQAPTAASVLRLCLTDAGIRNVVSSDAGWADATVMFQKRLKPEPASVAYPETEDEVALSIGCARNSSMKISALGAAHSFQGYGFGNDGNLVISMAAFNSVSYDKATTLLTFGGGTQVGPVMKHLWETAGRHTPHVRGSHVGVTGSSIGGGFGSTSRFLGTPMDNIISVRYMLYNGTIVDAGKGSDLLWAAQGAGSSYGIILSMTVETYKPVHSKAVQFEIAIGTVPLDIAARLFMAVQGFAISSACPDEMGLRWALATPPHKVAGTFYGDPATFDTTVAPLLRTLKAICSKITIEKKILGFWDMEVSIAGPGMNSPTGGELGGRAFYTQSLTTAADHPLTLKQITTLINATSTSFNRPDMKNSGYLDLWGGVSRDVQDKDTAYAHGNNLWLIRWDPYSLDSGNYPSDGVTYLKKQLKPFEKSLTDAGVPLRGFVNYADMELSESEWSARLYGNNYGRLKQIKRAVDPEGLFTSHRQSIPLT